MKQMIIGSYSAFHTYKIRIALLFFAMLSALSLGCASTPQIPVHYDNDTVNLMPKEAAIAYLNTVEWGPVWGRRCCDFSKKGVFYINWTGRGILTPYSKLNMWASGPWADGSYQLGLVLHNVNSICIVPPGDVVPPAEATRIITALEVLISTRTKK